MSFKFVVSIILKKMKSNLKFFVMSALLAFVVSCKKDQTLKLTPVDMKVNGEMVAELTAPPFVPKPVGNRPAKKLIVKMEIKE